MTNFSDQFRFAAPYIQSHRGKTFLVALPSDVFSSPNFSALMHDLALLSALGIRLIVVHGSRNQISERLRMQNLSSTLVDGMRITTAEVLPWSVSETNALTTQLIASLSAGLPNTPAFGLQLHVCTGNFITARPLGVIDGVDFGHSGRVRSVREDGIRNLLVEGTIVVISTIGYSLTGDLFSVTLRDLVQSVATKVRIDKLICFTSDTVLNTVSESSDTVGSTVVSNQNLAKLSAVDDTQALVSAAVHCVKTAGIRAHLIDYDHNGALLEELFSQTGCGYMLAEEDLESIQNATLADVGGILELIEPLERAGQLIPRSHQDLEREIERYRVIKIDGLIVAVAALILYPQERSSFFAELACIAVHPAFQNGGRGAKLVNNIFSEAIQLGVSTIFALSTEGEHWFLQQGFSQGRVEDLPEAKRARYNAHRKSKVFLKKL